VMRRGLKALRLAMVVHRRLVRQAFRLGLLMTLVALALSACGEEGPAQEGGNAPESAASPIASESGWLAYQTEVGGLDGLHLVRSDGSHDRQ
jgi:hypothetical protein